MTDRRFTVTIWGLPWTAVLQVTTRIPKRYMRGTKRERNAYRDGVSDRVAHTLTALDIHPDLYGDQA